MEDNDIRNIINDKQGFLYLKNADMYNFMSDYKDKLRKTAEIVRPTITVKNSIFNKLKEYLRLSNVSLEYYWIFMMINELTSIEDFTKRNEFYLPSTDTVNNIFLKYQHYRSLKENQTSIIINSD